MCSTTQMYLPINRSNFIWIAPFKQIEMQLKVLNKWMKKKRGTFRKQKCI